jgi:hypothetical protein
MISLLDKLELKYNSVIPYEELIVGTIFSHDTGVDSRQFVVGVLHPDRAGVIQTDTNRVYVSYPADTFYYRGFSEPTDEQIKNASYWF